MIAYQGFVAAAEATGSSLPNLLKGAGGATLILGLVGYWLNRRKPPADAAAVLGGAAVTIAGGYEGLLNRLLTEQERQAAVIDSQGLTLHTQGERIAYLEGKIEKTEARRDWWRARAQQFEELLRAMDVPIPHPVPISMYADGTDDDEDA